MAHELGTRKSFGENLAANLTLTVDNFSPVTVVGIEMSNTSIGTRIFVVSNSDGDTIIQCTVQTKESLNITTPFKADKGIRIVGAPGSGCSATVFHKSPGI